MTVAYQKPDASANQTEQTQDSKPSTKEDKKKAAEEKKREEYRKRQAEIEQLQRDNLAAMYPEYYTNSGAPNQIPQASDANNND